MSPNPIKILALLLVFTLTACATKVKSIKKDIDVNLKPDEGYLMFTVDTSFSLNKILITGEKAVQLTKDDLRKGSNTILITLPEGNYRFEQITFDTGWYRNTIELNEGYWDFKAKSGSISYVGHIRVKRTFWGRNTEYVLINKASQALEYLEQNFANILASRTIDYQGPGEDNFFKVVNSKGATQ